MNKREEKRSPLYRRIGFGFTAHPITVWAGVILLRLYFEWIKLREELSAALVGFAKRSNNQISSVDVMLSWFYGLALGAERFEHFTRYRRGGVVGGVFWVKGVFFPGTVWRVVFCFFYLAGGETSETAVRGWFAPVGGPNIRGIVGFGF